MNYTRERISQIITELQDPYTRLSSVGYEVVAAMLRQLLAEVDAEKARADKTEDALREAMEILRLYETPQPMMARAKVFLAKHQPLAREAKQSSTRDKSRAHI